MYQPNTPLRIGASVYAALMSNQSEVSFPHVVSTLKFCLLEHFARSPLSALCLPPKELQNFLKNLTNNEWNSLQTHLLNGLKGQDRTDISSLLIEASVSLVMCSHLVAVLGSLVRGAKIARLSVRMESSDSEYYKLLLSPTGLVQTEKFKELIEKLQCSATPESVDLILQDCQKALKGGGKLVSKWLSRLREFQKDFENAAFLKKQRRLENEPKNSPVPDLKKKLKLSELQSSLMQSKKKPDVEGFPAFRKDFFGDFHTQLENLTSIHPGVRSIFIFDDLNTFYQCFSPQVSVSKTLLSLTDTPHAPTSTRRLGKSFALLKEWPGKHVNYYDWIRSYLASEDLPEDKDEIAKFMLSAKELAHLGFIQPPKGNLVVKIS